RLHVVRLGGRHRLDGYRGAAPDLHGADVNGPRGSTRSLHGTTESIRNRHSYRIADARFMAPSIGAARRRAGDPIDTHPRRPRIRSPIHRSPSRSRSGRWASGCDTSSPNHAPAPRTYLAESV